MGRMTSALIITSSVLFFLAIAAGVVLLEIVENAPEGYEDLTGFREEPEPPIVTPTNPPQETRITELPPEVTPTPKSRSISY
jgi:hypothetical protein